MAEWPVRVVDYAELLGRNHEPIAPGEPVLAARTFGREGDERVFDGVTIDCPLCGSYGFASVEGGSQSGSGWVFEPAEPEPGDALTMRPSIVCTTEGCPGHYWLTDGVLREV